MSPWRRQIGAVAGAGEAAGSTERISRSRNWRSSRDAVCSADTNNANTIITDAVAVTTTLRTFQSPARQSGGAIKGAQTANGISNEQVVSTQSPPCALMTLDAVSTNIMQRAIAPDAISWFVRVRSPLPFGVGVVPPLATLTRSQMPSSNNKTAYGAAQMPTAVQIVVGRSASGATPQTRTAREATASMPTNAPTRLAVSLDAEVNSFSHSSMRASDVDARERTHRTGGYKQ